MVRFPNNAFWTEHLKNSLSPIKTKISIGISWLCSSYCWCLNVWSCFRMGWLIIKSLLPFRNCLLKNGTWRCGVFIWEMLDYLEDYIVIVLIHIYQFSKHISFIIWPLLAIIWILPKIPTRIPTLGHWLPWSVD